MSASVVINDSFLETANELPKEAARKVFKALRLFVRNPNHPGLNREKLQGRASELWSLRVDEGYRIIYCESPERPVFLFVGSHQDAYRFAGAIAMRPSSYYGYPDARRTSAYEMPARSPVPSSQLEQTSVVTPSSLAGLLPGVVKIDDLEQLITTKKYLPLARVLAKCPDIQIEFSFQQIETIIGDALPPSAHKHRPWWANERGRHVQASAWLGVGWKVESVDTLGGLVRFERPQ
jgi:mRNA-degrading endonuclease RelE of RelBE toxin-antitoxin system